MPAPRATLLDGWYAWPADAPQHTERRVRCASCAFFIPDRVNPAAGFAGCKKGLIGAHAMALHFCREFDAATPITTVNAGSNGECEAQS